MAMFADSGAAIASGARHAAMAGAGRTASMMANFNLLRWFAGLSLALILLVGVASAALVSRLVTQSVIERDIGNSMDLIQRYVQAESAYPYFTGEVPPDRDDLRRFFEPLAHLPDVVRTKVYGAQRTVIWATDENLVGGADETNDELQAAFAGALSVSLGTVGESAKSEHATLAIGAPGARFIEAYVPIRGRDPEQVVGVVELYRMPGPLQTALVDSDRTIWIGAAIGGLLLYATLFLVVLRARRLISDQQARLSDAEAYAAVGEMASAVAHGVRNPLASIRSSAELVLGDGVDARDCARDIVHEVDRLDRWVRGLLAQAQPEGEASGGTDVNAVLRQCLIDFAPSMERLGIALKVELDDGAPPVRASAALGQVFDCLLGNAVDAMPKGGRIAVATKRQPAKRRVEIVVTDDGPGIPRENLGQVFRPFFTTKRGGLGLGLGLSRRIVQRSGGTLVLESHPGQGTTAVVRLPVAEAGA